MAGRLRSLLVRATQAFPRGNAAPGVPSASEPCAVCGEETAVGAVFYSDRHTIEHADGRRTYLCTLCHERVRSSRPGKRLTDDEVRAIDPNGFGAIIATLSDDRGGGRC
jgi:CRISPR/Cas system-associated protein Cas10 (large subunit of type III CRISPR-Cas system)